MSDGEGRNGVWLAQQGHAVLAVDTSDLVDLCDEVLGCLEARRPAGLSGIGLVGRP